MVPLKAQCGGFSGLWRCGWRLRPTEYTPPLPENILLHFRQYYVQFQPLKSPWTLHTGLLRCYFDCNLKSCTLLHLRNHKLSLSHRRFYLLGQWPVFLGVWCGQKISRWLPRFPLPCARHCLQSDKHLEAWDRAEVEIYLHVNLMQIRKKSFWKGQFSWGNCHHSSSPCVYLHATKARGG